MELWFHCRRTVIAFSQFFLGGKIEPVVEPFLPYWLLTKTDQGRIMKRPHLLSASAALLLMSCKPNYTGTYESAMLQKIHQDNKFAPEGTGFLKLRPSASYLDFSPFKVILARNGESYQGSVEFLRYQKQGMTGMIDDTSSVIFNISSTSLSNDTLSFVFGNQGELMGSLNMKGFVTKEKGKFIIGIDRNLIEDFDAPELNPFMINNSTSMATYITGKEITNDMKLSLFESQRKELVAELDSADKYDRPKINSSIIYLDSVLLPQIKKSN